MTEEIWTTKYEVDFYTKALHCNRQRYSVLRRKYALLIRKMEENNALGLFKTWVVFYLEFYGVLQQTMISSEEKIHEQKEMDWFLIMGIIII